MKTLLPLGLALLAAPVFASTKAPAAVTTSADTIVGPVQTIQGRVWRVDLSHKELTVKGKSGVLFDFQVEPSTHIKSDWDDKVLTFSDLLGADQITVEFAPEEKGDVAESIEVGKLNN